MPRKHIDVSVSNDEFEDLNNALEDHRDSFKQMAEEAIGGFGLEPEYWAGRAQEVERLRKTVHEHSTEEPEQRGQSSGKPNEGIDPGPARGKDFESDSRQ